MLVHIIPDSLHFILSKSVKKWQSYNNNNIVKQAVDSPFEYMSGGIKVGQQPPSLEKKFAICNPV